MRTRTVLSALIFLVLCAVKFGFPENASKVRDIIVPAISREANFREDFIAIGRAISGDSDYVYVWESRKKAETEDQEQSDPEEAQEPTKKADVSGEFSLSEMIEQNLNGFEAYTGTPSEDRAAETMETPEIAETTKTPEIAETPEANSESSASNQTAAPIAPETVPIETSSSSSLQAAKVEAFLSEQAAFSNYAVPANVSYDVPSLPFEFASPCASSVTSGFGYREHPLDSEVKFHYGTDLGAYDGDAITAFACGTVISVQEFDGYGLTVIIEHAGGFSTLYAHCSQILVEAGASVECGDKIALAGHSGHVTGPHLHFELIYNGKYLNPEFYL